MAKKAIYINEAGFTESVCGSISATTFQLASGATDGYVLTSDADGNASWQEGASSVYTANSPATCTVGGITPGYVLTGRTLECILQDAIAPYIVPTFSAFSVDIDALSEVGTVIDGTCSFTWSTTTGGNVASNSIGICDVTNANQLATGLANDGSESLDIDGPLSNASPTTWTWQITGCSTQGDSFSRNRTRSSVYPYFWGVETCGVRPTINNDLITGGTKVVNTVSSSVGISFNSVGQWTWFAMPSNCTSRTKWFQGAAPNCGDIAVLPTDKYPDEVCVNVTSPDGCWSSIEYKVYLSGSAATDGSTPIEFRTS